MEGRRDGGALLDAFDEYLRPRAAQSTRGKYRQHLEHFNAWLDGRIPAEASVRDIELDYLAGWQSKHERMSGFFLSPRTIKNRIATLRSFYRFLERFDLLVDRDGAPVPNPMRGIDPPRVEGKANDWLVGEEDQAILDADMSRRERFVWMLLRWTGLRVGEATSLVISDVDLAAEEIRVTNSKTARGRRTVPILPELEPHLRSWLQHLEERGFGQPAAWLLPGRNGAALSASTVWRLVKRVPARVGIRVVDRAPTISPHTLRRTFGSYLLNKGVRLETVSRLLGHSSTTITEQAYAELLDSTIAAELSRVLNS